jgi:hypothetical protein
LKFGLPVARDRNLGSQLQTQSGEQVLNVGALGIELRRDLHLGCRLFVAPCLAQSPPAREVIERGAELHPLEALPRVAVGRILAERSRVLDDRAVVFLQELGVTCLAQGASRGTAGEGERQDEESGEAATAGHRRRH